jgi:hypothetical protein
MTPDTETATCCVCLETVDDSNASECNGCGQRYHLNQRNDRPGKDCGDVWINDDTLALEFGCQTCIDAVLQDAPPAVDPMLQPFLSQIPSDMLPGALRAMQAAASSEPGAASARPAAAAGSSERKRRYRKWE